MRLVDSEKYFSIKEATEKLKIPKLKIIETHFNLFVKGDDINRFIINNIKEVADYIDRAI